MIAPGDTRRPAKVLVLDGQPRDWRWLWLRRRAIWRLVFAGFIDSAGYSLHAPGRIELVDGLTRLGRFAALDGESQSHPRGAVASPNAKETHDGV
jgi:hypothetical protein